MKQIFLINLQWLYTNDLATAKLAYLPKNLEALTYFKTEMAPLQ